MSSYSHFKLMWDCLEESQQKKRLAHHETFSGGMTKPKPNEQIQPSEEAFFVTQHDYRSGSGFRVDHRGSYPNSHSWKTETKQMLCSWVSRNG